MLMKKNHKNCNGKAYYFSRESIGWVRRGSEGQSHMESMPFFCITILSKGTMDQLYTTKLNLLLAFTSLSNTFSFVLTKRKHTPSCVANVLQLGGVSVCNILSTRRRWVEARSGYLADPDTEIQNGDS